MPYGTHIRRNPPRFAWFALALVLAAGCQRPLVQRIDPLPVPPLESSDEPRLTPPAPPPAQPSTAPLTVKKPRPTPAKVADKEPAPTLPTPMLDALKQRSEEVRSISLAALDEPEPPQPKPEVRATVEIPQSKPLSTVVELPPPRDSDEGGKKGNEKSAAPESAAPSRPDDPWRDGLERLRAVARDRKDGSADMADPWALRARLLDALAELSGPAEAAERWARVLAPLVPSPADERARASEIRAAVETLEALAPLEITELKLCRKVSGFGSYEPLPPTSCKAGRSFILYCEIGGLRYEPTDDVYRSRLATHVEVVTAPGEKRVWSQALGTAEDLCRRRRRDYFVNYRISLPATMPPGKYELRLTQTDLIADRSTTFSLPLALSP